MPERLTPEQLALLNCRSVGETFTSEDRASLTALIQLAGDRLETITRLERTLARVQAWTEARFCHDGSHAPRLLVLARQELQAQVAALLRAEEPPRA